MNDIEILIQTMLDHDLWEGQVQLKRHEYLKVEGSIDTNLYYIVNGSLRVFVLDGDDEHTIRFGYQGNLICSLDSFITESPSSFYIQALKKTNLKLIKKKTFFAFINSDKKLQPLWVRILELLILQQMEREKDLLTSSPKERYRRVASRSPQLFQEIPNKYIAEYLRMTPETLSRIKKS